MSEEAEVTEIGRTVRRLLRSADRAALGTLMPDGTPYVSLVLTAIDHDGTPLLLLSGLAQHTRNLQAAAPVSLLFDATGGGGAASLAGTRVSLVGTAVRDDDPRWRARFLARHPGYADFADFACWRVMPARAHLIAGFGRIQWLERDAFMLDPARVAALIAAESRIVNHMNDDHGDAIDLYATVLKGMTGRGWRMTGIDPDGVDLRQADIHVRVGFRGVVADSAQARAEFVQLAGDARKGVRHAAC